VTTSKRFVLAASIAVAALAAAPATSTAQPRGRRVVVRAPVFIGGYYASPYWLYDPRFGFGYADPWGPYPYPYPDPYRGYAVDSGASLRLDVRPHEAEVYVDGYYSGIVDDFDGAFQRLHLRPGEHELTLYLDGYRTVHQKVYLTPKNTFKVKYTMEPLAAGDQPEARPQPPNPPPAPEAAPPAPMYPPPMRGRRAPQGPPPGPPLPPPPMPGNAPRAESSSAYGSLAIRVQPGDADVLIDGEVWRSPPEQERLVVEVAEGPHTIEIRKAGYRSYVASVGVRRGETTPINVSLRSQEER